MTAFLIVTIHKAGFYLVWPPIRELEIQSQLAANLMRRNTTHSAKPSHAAGYGQHHTLHSNGCIVRPVELHEVCLKLPFCSERQALKSSLRGSMFIASLYSLSYHTATKKMLSSVCQVESERKDGSLFNVNLEKISFAPVISSFYVSHYAWAAFLVLPSDTAAEAFTTEFAFYRSLLCLPCLVSF